MSLLEVTLLIFISPLVLFIRNLIVLKIRCLHLNTSSLILQIIEGFLLIIPSLLSFTVLSEFVCEIVITGLTVAVVVFTNTYYYTSVEYTNFRNIPLYLTTNKCFVTNFRSLTNVLSCISILAVDFSIFPTRFHKSELFGGSLMDIGVGTYIGMSALVLKCITSPTLYIKRSFYQQLVSTLKSCSFIMLIGLGRLALLNLFSYHQPVTEYGLHWNFFLTIAVVRLIAFGILSILPLSLLPLLFLYSLPFILIYQWGLNHGLTDYLQHGRFDLCSNCSDLREGFLNSNREGIFSSIGFTWIYLASISTGYFLHYNLSTLHHGIQKFVQLFLLAIFSWLATWLSQEYIQPISRRAANLAYCMWTLSIQLSFLAVFLVVDCLFAYLSYSQQQQRRRKNGINSKQLQPKLLEAVNRYQLIYFLAANLLTGLINVIIKERPISKSIGFLLILGYQSILTVTVVLLNRRNV